MDGPTTGKDHPAEQSGEATAQDLDGYGRGCDESAPGTTVGGQPAYLPSLQTTTTPRKSKMGLEAGVALAASSFLALLLVLTSLNSGPLWRDETNTLNLAQMSSLKELWSNLPFESFPPLWPLLLRGWAFLGMAGSDGGIRVLGLFVGLFFLASLWLCAHWAGRKAPMISLALLGSVPAVLFTTSSNRAYGLGMCLLVLAFGTIWRMLESPSRSRIGWAFLVSMVFLHCVYYNAIFLGAMLLGAGLVVVRRRQWKTLAALVAIGVVAGLSLAVYLPIIRQTSQYAPLLRAPALSPSFLWGKLSDALAARSSAQFAGPPGQEAWFLGALLVAGGAVALALQVGCGRAGGSQQSTATRADTAQARADLALFSAVSMLCGTAAFLGFLLKLRFVTQPWYYMEMLSLCAISLDCIFNVSWPALRPWGWLRIAFLTAMILWGLRSVWEEAHTRRSNVDLIAAVLEQKTAEKDMIVVYAVWEGITFDRYYHGRAHWVAVPPLNSYKVHRTDLMREAMKQRDPMAPVLGEITDTLRSGNRVWVVGRLPVAHPKNPPAARPSPPSLPTKWWVGPYIGDWGAQVNAHLMGCAAGMRALELPLDVPVNNYEDLSLSEFWGYRAGKN